MIRSIRHARTLATRHGGLGLMLGLGIAMAGCFGGESYGNDRYYGGGAHSPAPQPQYPAPSDPTVVPASECMKTGGDYDVVLRSTKAKPALLIGVGPTQVISQDRAQVDVFTTSGGLTETLTAYSLSRGRDGRWRVTSEEDLLQV